MYRFPWLLHLVLLSWAAAAGPVWGVSPATTTRLIDRVVVDLADRPGVILAIGGITAEGPVDGAALRALETDLTVDLVNRARFSVVTRSELEKVLTEQNFQLTDLVGSTSPETVGRLQGANALLTGTWFGERDELHLEVVDVATAEITSAVASTIPRVAMDGIRGLFTDSLGPANVAVSGIHEAGGGVTAETRYLESALVTALAEQQRAGRRLHVISRLKIDRILQELQFQLSDLIDEKTMQRVGQMLGADAIITGTYDAERERLTLYLLEVATARYISAARIAVRPSILGIRVGSPVFYLALAGVGAVVLAARRLRRKPKIDWSACRQRAGRIDQALQDVRRQYSEASRTDRGEEGLVERMRQIAGQVYDLQAATEQVGAAPPDLAQAQTRFLQALKELKAVLYRDMVPVPAGKFPMGDDNGKADESPGHEVFLSSFYIDPRPVTNREYKEFLDATRHPAPHSNDPGTREYQWRGGTYPAGTADHPVVLVSYEDAVAYARWRGKRLPTEAEWERAAIGRGPKTRYPWGNAFDREMLNSRESNLNRVTKAGSYPPNSLGVYDVVGNTWEWVADWYAPDAYHHHAAANPTGPETGARRAIRGGSWNSNHHSTRVTQRGDALPTDKHPTIGFRCVRDDFEN